MYYIKNGQMIQENFDNSLKYGQRGIPPATVRDINNLSSDLRKIFRDTSGDGSSPSDSDSKVGILGLLLYALLLITIFSLIGYFMVKNPLSALAGAVVGVIVTAILYFFWGQYQI